MSADANFSFDQSELISQASRFIACDRYRVEGGESRHICAKCGGALMSHIVVALRTRVEALEAAHVQPAQ